MVVAGGMRTVWGAVLGAAVLGLLPEALSSLEHWRFLLYGLILLVITMFVPQGLLLGTRDLAVEVWRCARRPRPAVSPASRAAAAPCAAAGTEGAQ